MATDLVRRTPWIVSVFLFKVIMPLVCAIMTWFAPNGTLRTTTKSASDMMKAAFEVGPPLCEQPKGWYMSGSERAEPSAESKDGRKRKTLWRDSIRYAHLAEGETTLVEWQ